MPQKKTKATSVDIAYHAGVSQATVSRVLRGSPLVNAETRQRVLDAVQALNYKVDRRASSLRTQRAGTLALLLFEDPTEDESHINPFFLSMLGSITRACARNGHDLLVSFQQLSDDWHADYEDSMKADGLILLGYGDYVDYRPKLEKLVAQGTHFVRWGAVLAGQPGVSIGCDNFAGGRMVAEHLVGRGRRRIAFLGYASSHYPEFFERYRGCDALLREAGLSTDAALQVDALSSEEEGYQAAKALLAREAAFDAVFAASDLIAIGAIRALNEHGLRVPEDIAVVGFDDIAMARFATPPLTTVIQDTGRAGELLVETLLRLVRDQPAESMMLPAKLVVRKSSGA
jgi:DNA-binding LacI/PurR family transcriptional regulator